ncbi:DUF4065 domain-containing protein [Planococcus liqunii]|uniref:type II TA system antitoxin MqsA family protein n=1 Tax=Planococcus liqunii TaxID=3058394 RepID=UPI002607283C|nr:type II TA system antitoxin MqsA family protein [Planococcus sp. N056]WKA50204.1 DUF4065 domain-containing protein [Planococcus sp. N056]
MEENLKVINYNCPFCNNSHPISVMKEKTKALVNDTPVEYEEIYYHCEIEDEDFVPKEILSRNLLAARDSYRKQNRLLTSQEIKDIRKLYKLSQKEFAQLLGWGDTTIQRYEKKSIQDETYDQRLRTVKENPKVALDSLEKHKEKFTQEKYLEIRSHLVELVKTQSVKYFNKEIIESLYVDYRMASQENGYTQLNLEKVENMLIFFTQSIPRIDRIKLMELLWYTDTLFFKKYGRGMSGQVYMNLPFGTVPKAYEEILKYSQASIEVLEKYSEEKVEYRILPKSNVNLSKFSAEEISVLQYTLEKFKDMNNKKISDYMSSEIISQVKEGGHIIPYSL